MAHGVCPWWIGYLLASPLRRMVQDPQAILGPLVREGMTVLEPGSGMGFFTLELARLVGPRGRVIAVDLQGKMLQALRRRAERAGLAGRVETRLAGETSLGVGDLAGVVDFVLAFAMVHELPNQNAFFAEVARTLKAGGRVLLVEPSGHVTAEAFAASLAAAEEAGLHALVGPTIRFSRSAVIEKV